MSSNIMSYIFMHVSCNLSDISCHLRYSLLISRSNWKLYIFLLYFITYSYIKKNYYLDSFNVRLTIQKLPQSLHFFIYPSTINGIWHWSFSGERVYDVTFWKSELNNEIQAMENETDNLKVPCFTQPMIQNSLNLDSSLIPETWPITFQCLWPMACFVRLVWFLIRDFKL